MDKEKKPLPEGATHKVRQFGMFEDEVTEIANGSEAMKLLRERWKEGRSWQEAAPSAEVLRAVYEGWLETHGMEVFRPYQPGSLAKGMYACRVFMDHAQARGDWDDFARQAMALGAKSVEYEMALRVQPEWQWAQDRKKTLRDISETENEKRARERGYEHLRWQEEAQRVWQTNANLGKSAVANIVKRRLSLEESVRTIRARITKVGEAR
tara:strand:- start:247 stop:876 length:630 start_codon:yes stop_codon:yes gene_type:complete